MHLSQLTGTAAILIHLKKTQTTPTKLSLSYPRRETIILKGTGLILDRKATVVLAGCLSTCSKHPLAGIDVVAPPVHRPI